MNFKKRILCFLFILIFTSVGTDSFVFAKTEPWQSYLKYIPDKVISEKRHLRATWVATVVNMDWPSKESAAIVSDKERIAKQKSELITILDEAVDLKLNAVIFQVKPTSDAFYKSEIAPWSYFMTNKLNVDPGFDPLAFIIEEAHARNLELHVWFNPYRVSMTASSYGLKNLDLVKKMLSTDPKNIYSKHPDWVKVAQDRLVLDPGIPHVREYVEESIMEVVKNYDVDAVHFDDYFYTGTTGGSDGIDDSSTYEKYNNGNFTNIDDWRRNNITTLVQNISKKIKAEKAWVKFGISPAGVWRNKKDDPMGSNTTAGIPNYDHAFADTRKWVLENTIDYIVPQVYWSFGLPAAGYGVVCDWWADLLKNNPSSNTQLYIGEGLYRISSSSSDPYWRTNDGSGYEEFARQLKYNISRPEIGGSVLFRHTNIRSEILKPIINTMKTDLWKNIALVPTMSKLGGTAPSSPIVKSVVASDGYNKLVWQNTETSKDELNATKYYAIYRVGLNETLNIFDAKNIIALVPHKDNVLSYIDKTGTSKHKYSITALNRLHDESLFSNVMSSK